MFLAVSLSSGLLQMHSQALITDPTTQALSVPFPPLKMWAVGMQWGCGFFSEHHSVWHPYQQTVTVKDLPLGGAAVIYDFKSSPFALEKANLTILSPRFFPATLLLPSCPQRHLRMEPLDLDVKSCSAKTEAVAAPRLLAAEINHTP